LVLTLALASSVAAAAAAPAQNRPVAMLFQVMYQFQQDVVATNLEAIHNEDAFLGAAISQLMTHPDGVAANRQDAFTHDLTRLGQQSGALHLAADADQPAQARAAFVQLTNTFSSLTHYFSSNDLAAAQAAAYRFTCPMHPDTVGGPGDTCPKCGMALDQMIRILPNDYDLPNAIHATIRTDTRLTVGQPVTAKLRLLRPDDEGVLLSDLIETHTKKIHLLIIDHSLTDYHHEHPQPTEVPGEYVFTFTPQKPGPYRVWADLRPYPLGLQEYVIADIPADTAPRPATNQTLSTQSTVDGLNYELFLDQPTIHVAKPVRARLRITTREGKPFTALEPIMATFAHIVGFNEDFHTVLHIHPNGAPVLDANARGGPELEFQIYALQPGFVRLFAQVQVGGQSHFAPFGIEVVP
jgi:hypothetical protein